ncbi:MAG TPA: hypothetical protein VHC69_03295 [Polyangiaceae bacterium]|nr:hypothetical protein [Polyangiaceae bacterium]
MLRRFVVVPFVAAAAPGCVTDHDVLAEQTPDARPAFEGGTGVRPVQRDASSDAASEATPPPPQMEAAPPPSGTRSLTFVHGVTDSPWVACCFSVLHDGKTTALPRPFPEGGLSYGASVRVTDGEFADLAADGIASRLVLADSPDAVAGLDCASVLDLANQLAVYPPPGDASPVFDAGSAPALFDAAARPASPRDASMAMDGSSRRDASAEAGARDASVPVAAVRVASLPLLPPGALAVPRGYVLVVGGCAGGRGVTDPSEQSICGEGYSSTAPTLNAYVVAPPANAPKNKVELTVLGATPAVTQFDLGFIPGLSGDLVTVATRVAPGALRPLSGYTASSSVGIGASDATAHLQLFAFGSSVPIYDQDWAPTLAASGVSAIEDGASYTLIVVGPFPGFSKRRWWNDPLVTVVRNE